MKLNGKQFRHLLTQTSDYSAQAIAISGLLKQLDTHRVSLDDASDYLESLGHTLTVDAPSSLLSQALRAIAHLAPSICELQLSGQTMVDAASQVVPGIINQFAHSELEMVALEALERYWLAVPKPVEQMVAQLGIHNEDTNIVQGCLTWYSSMLPHLRLDPYLNEVVSVLTKGNVDEKTIAIKVLGQFSSKGAAETNSLKVKLLTANVSSAVRDQILKPKAKPTLRSRPPSRQVPPPTPTVASVQTTTLPPGLAAVLTHVNYSVEVLDPVDDSPSEVAKHVEEFRVFFDGKETEKNWQARDKSVRTMRGWLRQSPPSTAARNAIIELSEGICKSIKSNRTTLCVQGCHLAKDYVMITHNTDDEFTAKVIPVLHELTSTTKQMSHTHGNMVVVAVCLIAPHPSAVAKLIRHASSARNDQPRQYASLWLQIYLERFANLPEYDGTFVADTVAKLVADVNPKVRSGARDAFLLLEANFPEAAAAVFAGIPPNYAKAIRSHGSASSSRPGSAQGRRTPSLDSQRRVSEGRPKPFSRQREEPAARRSLSATSTTVKKRIGTVPRSSSPPARPSRTSSSELVKPFESRRPKGDSIPQKEPGSVFRKDPDPVFKKEILPVSNPASEPVLTKPHVPQTSQNESGPSHLPEKSTSAVAVETSPIKESPRTTAELLVSPDYHTGLDQLLQSPEFNDPMLPPALHQLSIQDPNALFPLFRQQRARLTKVVTAKDFLRLMCVSQYVSGDFIETFLSYGRDTVVNTIIELMSWCESPSNVSSLSLRAHIIERKNDAIIPSLVRIMAAIFPDRIALDNQVFSLLLSQLLEFAFVVEDPWEGGMGDFLRRFHRLNSHLFDVEMLAMSGDRAFIESLISDGLPVEEDDGDYVMSPVKVVRGTPSPFNPVSTIPSTLSAATTPSLKSSEERVGLPVERQEVLTDQPVLPDQAGFVDQPRADLSEDFAQVSLAEAAISQESIQQMIDRVDPLRPINRGKAISIFEDKADPKTTQPTWFTLMLARFRLVNLSDFDEVDLEATTEEVEVDGIAEGKLDEERTYRILKSVRNHPQVPSSLEPALWDFFANCPPGNQVWGLVIIKQLLESLYPLQLQSLWKALCRVASDNYQAEIVQALDEISNDVVSGKYTMNELVQVVLMSFRSGQPNTLFHLKMMAKMLAHSEVLPYLDSSTIALIHDHLNRSLGSEDVKLRQAAVMAYAELVKQSRTRPGIQDEVTKVVGRLTLGQRKLVEFYSKNK